ncbi:ATP-binding protein [Acidithiobacillus ferrooxidans]|uniref:ATP-binding protein n=1 Tax=Acidithiobacillus ferrooxidans TaxID=920 RepID=UPI001D0025B6|nr:ATP-binding protein [Acidithiobacillus ferrooxidans]
MASSPTDIPLLPEFRDNPFINRLPPQLSQRKAWQFLSDPPEFSPAERSYPIHLRMNCLYRLRRFFEPLEHHLRLESAFSTLLRQGYVSRNPLQTDYIRRLQDGHERILARDLTAGRHYVGGTAEGFALIGASGAGKSTAINRILSYYPQVITHDEPFSLQQVVWLKLDCPHQGSPKQLCMHFFQELDLALGTRTFAQFGKTRNPVDLMMAQMAQLANRHALGVLIIDEIQHLTLAKGVGRDALLNFLVTLINTIGIPVITIGTMGALSLFQDDFRQARRANGLGCAVWERLPPESAWDHFVNVLWKYQWTRQETPLTDEIRQIRTRKPGSHRCSDQVVYVGATPGDGAKRFPQHARGDGCAAVPRDRCAAPQDHRADDEGAQDQQSAGDQQV